LIELLPLTFKLSNEAKVELEGLGFEGANLDYIERICNYGIWCDETKAAQEATPREIKGELKNLAAALDRVLEIAENNTGLRTYDYMAQVARFSDQEKFKRFAVGFEKPISQLLEPFESALTGIEELRDLAKLAYGNIDLRPGPPGSAGAKAIALWLASIMGAINVRPTKYVDGPYFRALEILFREALPDSKPESHRNYGSKAVDVLPTALPKILTAMAELHPELMTDTELMTELPEVIHEIRSRQE